MASLFPGALLLLTMSAVAGFRIPEKARGRVSDVDTDGDADLESNHQGTSVAQKIEFQTGASGGLVSGVYTIQQVYRWRYLDAYTTGSDYRATTRTAQGDSSQQWKVVRLGSSEYTIMQMMSHRLLDAYTRGSDYQVTTRTSQGDNSQVWILRPNNRSYTVQQKINGRYLDAYTSGNDYRVTTRTAQGNPTQLWFLDLKIELPATGVWESVFSCVGCDGSNYSYKIETTTSTGRSVSVSNSREVTGTISAAFKFLGASVSSTTRNSVTRETTSQLTQVTGEQFDLRCSRDPSKSRVQLFRWTVISNEVYVQTDHFRCHNTNGLPAEPKCPYGSCSNDLCDVCRPWRA